ncbi:torsin-1A-like [Bufo gargarizans]|uniref:torsin-1A-like n=1 Tax=Bufo gargarizans TaxID=30331 RepID=UPI001CF442ED|nr:torsin-1A-like [Bufo gargarizans]
MKWLQDFYQILVVVVSLIDAHIWLPCDRLACYMSRVPASCECCPTEGVINITGLQYDLDTELFGQHLAREVIIKLMQNEERLKPLVLSFHGLTGSGKTYVSQILAKHFNPRGAKSNFVHKIVASAAYPHTSQVETYKDQLHAWIKGNVLRCDRSIFIFDEVDKMHPELLHSLMPYLDYHGDIGGVSYRRSVFIFMSNTGAQFISDMALEYRRQGKKREEIKLFDIENELSSHLLTSMKSEFYDCDLIKRKVIDVIVPFLPMELEHVEMCARAELKRRGRTVDEEVVSRIAKGMLYYPKGENIFSDNGCKNVHIRVNF